MISTRAGYTGGENENPTDGNHPGHAEAVEIVFDPERTSCRDILEFFFQIHDPTTEDRQGKYTGSDYRSEIFCTTDEQRQVAEDTIADVEASGPARSSPRSARPAPSGRPRPKTRTTSSATQTATAATSRGRAGSCHTARPRPN